MTESDLKSRIKALLEAKGAFWSMVTGGAYSKSGDPDIVACYKGWYLAIEAKTYKGQQRPDQKLRQEQIEAANGLYILARSVSSVEEVLENIDFVEQI